MERVKGIEPSYEAWEASVLPLNYTRAQAIPHTTMPEPNRNSRAETCDKTLMDPAPPELRALYDEAFRRFGPIALWSSRPVPNPTIAGLLAITGSLRVEGGIQGRRLAVQIETACENSTPPPAPEPPPT